MVSRRKREDGACKEKFSTGSRGWILLGVFSGLALLAVSFLSSRGSRPPFDEARSFEHILRQCSFGPRIPGTKAHRDCLEYITNELGRYASQITHHDFTYMSHALQKEVKGTNIWARMKGSQARESILLCAHWDSRPIADRDPSPANRWKGVPGANDGASGVALLLEVARILGSKPPHREVHIVLFDMEDMGDLPPNSVLRDPFCIGSSRFVQENPDFRPSWGILVDMVGKRGLMIKREAISATRARHLVDRIWAIARKRRSTVFSDEPGEPIFDDHVPFLEKGIPVVNLIDMDYPYWHTVEDTPEKCSPTSLKEVGEVILELIYGP